MRTYTSDRKISGAQIHVPTEVVDGQILKLIEGIGVEPHALSRIQELYNEHIRKLKGPTINEQVVELQARLQTLYEEEANLARRFAVRDLSDKTFELLHREWQDKIFEIQKQIAGLESTTEDIVTDLEHALRLLVRIPRLFPRLRTIDQGRLLRILFRRIIIDTQGKVIDFEMHPPFAYLTLLNNPHPEKPSRSKNEPIIWAGLRCFQPELPQIKPPVTR